MSSRNFDERFPAMFQPGGEEAAEDWPPPATEFVSPQAAGAPAHIAQGSGGQDAGTALAGTPQRSPQSSPVPAWPRRGWLAPMAAAVAMLCAGAFALAAQYWMPSSIEFGRAAFQGVELQPWGEIVHAAAPPLLAAGTGILAALLFLASRRTAARERLLRVVFSAAAVVVVLSGWTGIFAPVLFQDAAVQSTGGGTHAYVLPWTYMVGPSGTWLFAAGLLMLSVLVVVPAGGRPRPVRGLWLGAAMATAGLCALFVEYLAPLLAGVVIVEVFRGQVVTHQDWAFLAPPLVAPLLLSGLAVIGWALLCRAASPRRGPAATGGPSAVEPGQ